MENIKEILKNRIVSGMREYLTINVKYEDLGLKNYFLTKEKLISLLSLEDSGIEPGFVDEYLLYDPTITYNGDKLFLSLQLEWALLDKNGDIPGIFKSQNENILCVKDDTKFYYIRGIQGYLNPKFNFDEVNDEPYWLYTDSEIYGPKQFFYTKSDNCEKEIEVLERFKNNKIVTSDLFSGNFAYNMISSNTHNIENELVKDLSKLSNMCKTIYTEFVEDDLEITFAIRDETYIDKFLEELEKIAIKHNDKIK